MRAIKVLPIAAMLCLPAHILLSQPVRTLREITVSGSGYERGLQHGQQLAEEIGEIVAKWKANTTAVLGRDADQVLTEFYEYADFTPAIKRWTPDLYDEVRGIADGSGQSFRDVMVLNLLDEFWVYVDDVKNHHCSGVGVPATGSAPGYVAQNMDLERYTDGFQVLMRIRGDGSHPEQLLLTHAGLIVLDGLNAAGVAVCVNTLMQLKASPSGLPVAFVIRGLLARTDERDILDFVQNVRHASGQNYIIGIRGKVFDFEASANRVVRFQPENPHGAVYHTNHPLVNDDVKPWFAAFDPTLPAAQRPEPGNSQLRFEAVQRRMSAAGAIDDATIKEALRSKDDPKNPVCRDNIEGNYAFTFGSVIMTMADPPTMQVVAGPPDEGEYSTYTVTGERTGRE